MWSRVITKTPGNAIVFANMEGMTGEAVTYVCSSGGIKGDLTGEQSVCKRIIPWKGPLRVDFQLNGETQSCIIVLPAARTGSIAIHHAQ